MSDAPAPSARPTLPAGVRLQFDAARQMWVLLSPERVIELDGPASEILRRCDGVRPVQQIVAELAAMFDAERAAIAADVGDLLAELATKRLIRMLP